MALKVSIIISPSWLAYVFIARSWILSSNSSKFYLWWDSYNLIFGYWMRLVLWRQTIIYSWFFVSDQSKHKNVFCPSGKRLTPDGSNLLLQPLIFSLAFQNSAVWVEASLEWSDIFASSFPAFSLALAVCNFCLWPDWKAAFLGTQQSPPLNPNPGFLLGKCGCDHHIINVNHEQEGKETKLFVLF